MRTGNRRYAYIRAKRSFARFVEGVEKTVSESVDCGTPGLESNERMSVL